MVKNLPVMQETQVQSLGREVPWRREWLPTPVFLPGEFQGLRSPVGYSPWGHKESDTTERLTLFLQTPSDTRLNFLWVFESHSVVFESCSVYESSHSKNIVKWGVRPKLNLDYLKW